MDQEIGHFILQLNLHYTFFLIVLDTTFKIRDIFSKKIKNENGSEIPALPLPIDNQFRDNKAVKKPPALGAHNHLFNSEQNL